jgi:hypothetical protein
VLKKTVVQHELLDDISTSETPKKRHYPIPSSWPLTKPHNDILGQMNKLPLGNVDMNLAAQTPCALSHVRTMPLEEPDILDNLESRTVTPIFEKDRGIDKQSSEGRENKTTSKSRIVAPSRKRTLGTY